MLVGMMPARTVGFPATTVGAVRMDEAAAFSRTFSLAPAVGCAGVAVSAGGVSRNLESGCSRSDTLLASFCC